MSGGASSLHTICISNTISRHWKMKTWITGNMSLFFLASSLPFMYTAHTHEQLLIILVGETLLQPLITH